MIEFHTLGKIDLAGVEEDAVEAVLRGPKRLGLLAYLALARPGEHVRRDTLLALLWPEHDATRARHALRNTLYSLRRALGREVLRGRGKQDLAVSRKQLWCDAVAFREALAEGRREDALLLYRGELLPGMYVDGAGVAFERWLEEERRSLCRQARKAASALADAAEAVGHRADAVRWARRSLALEPLDETAIRRLMNLLVRSGNRAAALLAYEDFADHLNRELALEPGQETLALLRRLRSPAVRGASEQETRVVTGEAPGADLSASGTDRERPSGPLGDPVPSEDESRARTDESVAGTESVAGPWTRRRSGRVAAAVGVALALVTWVLNGSWASDPGGEREGATVEPLSWERVAVFPFLVRGANENGPLGEGLAGLLSTAFEGAGGVRTIDPRALASRLAESTVAFDPDLAPTVAESLGAAAYVLGEGVVSGAEIRLTAALYRPGQPSPIAHAEVKGAGDSALSLVDGLAVSLLTSAYPDTRLPLAHGAREITESPAALKEYLAGERPFRTGRFAAAHAAYQRAVALDTAFALAHHRLSVTAEWFGDRATALESARRAVRHAECLIERDRRLVEAHLASLEGDASEAEGLYRAILETWPHDLEARYQLGAILLHGAPAVVHSLSEARREFERIRALHPSHVPSLVYLARIAASEGRRHELERLVDRVLRSVPGSPHAWEMRALRAFVVGSEADQVAFAATLRDASDPDIRLAVWSLAVFGGELEAASRLAELMTEPRRSPETQELGRAWEVELALARGRWALARQTLPDPDIGSGTGGTTPLPLSVSLDFLPVPDLALQQACDRLGYPEGGRTESATDSSLAAVPPVRGEPTWPATRIERASRLERFRLAVMCSRAGDFDAALSAAVHLEQAEADPDLPSGRLLGRIVRAHVAWRRGLADEAADLLDEEPGETQGALTGGEGVESFQRYLRAIVLADAGRSEEALQWFGSFEGQHIQHLVFLAPAHFHQAHLLEELGRRDAARRHYWTFLRLWREADPELGAMRWEAVRNLTALKAG